mmetsp:Transcript_2008/g.5506  ORF Transcript_2008/g.5506 Transcript_2008/m.5506 type:complete len:209 (-) Transcript_2008:1490-2116(-)
MLPAYWIREILHDSLASSHSEQRSILESCSSGMHELIRSCFSLSWRESSRIDSRISSFSRLNSSYGRVAGDGLPIRVEHKRTHSRRRSYNSRIHKPVRLLSLLAPPCTWTTTSSASWSCLLLPLVMLHSSPRGLNAFLPPQPSHAPAPAAAAFSPPSQQRAVAVAHPGPSSCREGSRHYGSVCSAAALAGALRGRSRRAQRRRFASLR